MSSEAKLGKHRVYRCKCGAEPCRPLHERDTTAGPFPKPCDRCGRDLSTMPYTIADAVTHLRDLGVVGKREPDDG